MKYYFKSDYFTYVHPSNMPRSVSDFTPEDLEVAKENTAKFHINEELLETARYESDDTIPLHQKGTIILFPEIEPFELELMEGFIKDVFSKVESELGDEYNEANDPTIFWETGIKGRHFSGKTLNYRTKETFGVNSPSIYIAGCKDTTADYLVETAIDAMYNESRKHDRKSAKNGSEAINFERFKTFLVYHVGSMRFYEFGYHENLLWHRPSRSVGGMDYKVYEILLPHDRR